VRKAFGLPVQVSLAAPRFHFGCDFGKAQSYRTSGGIAAAVSVFGHRCCYNLHMPNKEADDKDRETERGEHDEKSKEQSATEEDRESEKKKLPEPPGNLRRRAEWFKKRH
jgi:hypothetical protein